MTSDYPGRVEQRRDVGVGDAHRPAEAMSPKLAGCDEALDGPLRRLQDFRSLRDGAELAERASASGWANVRPWVYVRFRRASIWDLSFGFLQMLLRAVERCAGLRLHGRPEDLSARRACGTGLSAPAGDGQS